ncbi:MAG: lipopolysaccharide heptosyltransferase II [Fidelibacterota bacterium]
MNLRIGIIAPNWVGDAVMALPFMNTCRTIYPDAKIIVLCKTWVRAIFESHPALDSVLAMDKRFQSGFRLTTQYGKDLRSMELDRVYLLSNSFRSAYIAWLSGTDFRVGFPSQGRSPFLNKIVPRPKTVLHRSERYLELLRVTEKEKFRGAGAVQSPGIHLTDKESAWAKAELEKIGFKQPLAVFPFSVAPARNIPFRKIVEILNESQNPILIFGNTGNQESGKKLEQALPGERIRSVCGKYTLRQAIALISVCQSAIATDSGLGHIAANLGIPTVSLFGAGNIQLTGPVGPQTTFVNKVVHCSPCRKNICENTSEPLICLHSITAREVWESLSSILQSTESG